MIFTRRGTMRALATLGLLALLLSLSHVGAAAAQECDDSSMSAASTSDDAGTRACESAGFFDIGVHIDCSDSQLQPSDNSFTGSPRLPRCESAASTVHSAVTGVRSDKAGSRFGQRQSAPSRPAGGRYPTQYGGATAPARGSSSGNTSNCAGCGR